MVGLHLFLTMGMGGDPFFGEGTGTGTSARPRPRSREGGDGEKDRAKFGVDCAALDDPEDCPYGPRPWRFNRSGGGFSEISARAMIVLETRASDSKEPSIRSSRRKRSPEVSPSVEEHEARNLVTFEVRTTPFSRLSMWTIDPGRTLFINLFFIFRVSGGFSGTKVFRLRYRGNGKGEGEIGGEIQRVEPTGSISKNGGGWRQGGGRRDRGRSTHWHRT